VCLSKFLVTIWRYNCLPSNVNVNKLSQKNGFVIALAILNYKLCIMMMAALMAAADFTTWNACEPQYSQLPFFRPSLKSMVMVGTFFKCDNHILRVVSHEGMNLGEKLDSWLLLNEFILLHDSESKQAPIFSGAGYEHAEVVQTLHQCTVPAG
jgi:hypothetical protein